MTGPVNTISVLFISILLFPDLNVNGTADDGVKDFNLISVSLIFNELVPALKVSGPDADFILVNLISVSFYS